MYIVTPNFKYDILLENTTKEVNSTFAQCEFIKTLREYEDSSGFFNYIDLAYCVIGENNLVQIIVAVIVLLVIFFMGLGITADNFLCPSLLVVSKTLGLSQNIAGVTFLAFGNGAPDIFSSLAGIKRAKPELVLGELYGAGIFVTTVVAGTILMSDEFKIMERPLLRDIIFYIVATFFVWYLFLGGCICFEHAIGFLVLYCLYIVVVIIGRLINNRLREKVVLIQTPLGISRIAEKFNQCHNGNKVSTLPHVASPVHHHLKNTIFAITHGNEDEACPNHCRNRQSQSISPTLTEDQERRPSLNRQNSVFSFLSSDSVLFVESPWKEFLIHIFPLDLSEWLKQTLLSKIFHLFKVPIYFLLNLTIPVVDYENHKNNWCRILNTFHIISGPFIVVFLTGSTFLFGVRLVWIVSGISIFLVILVLCTSSFHKPPRYHWLFGYLGFVISVSYIYAFANEVIDLLQVVGLLFGLSDVILGLTVLAWGNSIGDFISNLSITKQGFPRMGLSACFGGPLLNLLLGFGMPYSIALSEKKLLKLEYTDMISLLYGTITLSMVITLLTVYFTSFRAKKIHGIFLFLSYAVYLILAFGLEFKLFSAF